MMHKCFVQINKLVHSSEYMCASEVSHLCAIQAK